jgi:GNAT superfamily N-acetyltransferase
VTRCSRTCGATMGEAVRFSVRPFSGGEYAALADVVVAANPADPQTEQSLRHLDVYLRRRELVPTRIVAEDAAGRLIGHGVVVGRGPTPGAEVGVVPDARRRGLGTALLAELELLARANGAIALRTRWVAASDGPALAFVARHGFGEHERAWPSTLELASFDPSPYAGAEERLVADGIRITTLMEEGLTEPVLARVCALHNACVRDIPSRDAPAYTDVALDAWITWMVEGPNAIPEALFLAIDGGAYVGMSALDRSGPAGMVHQGFTGVLPSHRGRGIAAALKLRAIAHAREAGFRAIHTRQHAGNAPMLHLNARLGFVRGAASIRFEKPLVGS